MLEITHKRGNTLIAWFGWEELCKAKHATSAKRLVNRDWTESKYRTWTQM